MTAGSIPAPEAGSGAERQRKPYEPPAIEETSEFETLALNCTGLVDYFSCNGLGTYTNS